ncbi:MAG: phage tail protein [Gammaproteobacteria bacterium]|nr:phage tail protein [Gammaproteobacteria bacterium]
MEDSVDKLTNDLWPQRQFAFQLCWGELVFTFSEVSGLALTPPDVALYQPNEFMFKVPSHSVSNQSAQQLSFKRGLYVGQRSLAEWLEHFFDHDVSKQSASIQLQNEQGIVVWHCTIDSPVPVNINYVEPTIENNSVVTHTTAVELLVVQYRSLSNNTA